MQFEFEESHSHRGFSPVLQQAFGYKEPFQRFSFGVCAKAVETAAGFCIVCGSPV
jgi:hypothetical protein